MCLNTGTAKNVNFSFETNGKLMALGVPILKHFRVVFSQLPVIFLSYDFRVADKVGFLMIIWRYRKNSKIWDTSNKCHNCPKNRKV